MKRIRISIARDSGCDSSDSFQVYGDGGTGTIDWAHAITPRRQPLWPDGDPAVGGSVEFETPPVVFGRFQYAVVLEDAVGNPAPPCVQEIVVNSEPLAPADLKAVAHDGQTQQLTLTFSPSERLVG